MIKLKINGYAFGKMVLPGYCMGYYGIHILPGITHHVINDNLMGFSKRHDLLGFEFPCSIYIHKGGN